jgi:hypothetical protein
MVMNVLQLVFNTYKSFLWCMDGVLMEKLKVTEGFLDFENMVFWASLIEFLGDFFLFLLR